MTGMRSLPRRCLPTHVWRTEQTKKDSTRVAAGLKAAIHNPNVSEEAKEQAKERLRGMGQEVEPPQEPPRHEESPRVLAGYKASLSTEVFYFLDPNVSPQAKAHAQEVLQEAGILERDPQHSDEEHQTRVLAGYKAAVHNPRVSEEAKQHAREYLQEHGIEV